MTLDPKHAWQATVEAAGAPALAEVRAGAEKFYRKIRRRNLTEYVACGVVVIASTVRFFTSVLFLHKVGFALLVAAALYAPWQLHRRASAVPPEMAGTMPISAFMRSQLVRQRDALKRVLWWYLLPFVPGMAFIFAGNGLDPKIEAAGPPHWVRWLVFVGIFAFFVGVWWLNQVAARKLQRRIDEIDALTGEDA